MSEWVNVNLRIEFSVLAGLSQDDQEKHIAEAAVEGYRAWQDYQLRRDDDDS